MPFDVHRHPGRSRLAPFLVQLQHDRSSLLGTAVVAPLLRFDPRDDPGRLTPTVNVVDQKYLVSIAEVLAIESHRLGPVVCNLDTEPDHIDKALDFLVTGN